ncbi:MAG: hypothetical protein ABIY70_03055 [Capsulimonas sp.]|uniref:hypothetical protein n=1 Tax=Capsulimonas sp. TaxID=2494211 RepID=UPI003263814E
MRSQFAAIILASSCLFAAGVASHASVTARKTAAPAASAGNSDLSAIKAAYKDRSYAVLTRSAGQMYGAAAPDFMFSDRSGAKINRGAAVQRAGAALSTLGRVVGSPSDPQALTYTVDIMSVTFSGNQAIVIESGQVHALSVSDASAGAFAKAASALSGVYRDVWVRTSQGWRQKSATKL